MSDTVVLLAVICCCLSSSAAGAACAYYFLYLQEFDKKSNAVIVDVWPVQYIAIRSSSMAPEKDLVVAYGGGTGVDLIRYANFRVIESEEDEIRRGLQIEYQSRVDSKESRSRFKFGSTGRTVLNWGTPVAYNPPSSAPSSPMPTTPPTTAPKTSALKTSAPKTSPPKTSTPKK